MAFPDKTVEYKYICFSHVYNVRYREQEGTVGEQPAKPVSERQSQDAQRDASQCRWEEWTQVDVVPVLSIPI